MEKGEIIAIVRAEIERQLAIFSFGQTVIDRAMTEDVIGIFGGTSVQENIPKIMPFGLSSSATPTTISVQARAGADPRSRMVIGHRDTSRPSVLPGETKLYDAYGNVVWLNALGVSLGSATAVQPYVLGLILQNFLTQLMTQISTHTHPAPGAPPTNAPAFQALSSSFVTSGSILSTKIKGI